MGVGGRLLCCFCFFLFWFTGFYSKLKCCLTCCCSLQGANHPPTSSWACGQKAGGCVGRDLGPGESFLWGQGEFSKGWPWPRAVASSSVRDVQRVRGDIFHLSGNTLSQMSQLFLVFFASCYLFAVVAAGDSETLVLCTPPLWPKTSLEDHAGLTHTSLAPRWLGLVVPGRAHKPQATFWRPPQTSPWLPGHMLTLAQKIRSSPSCFGSRCFCTERRWCGYSE